MDIKSLKRLLAELTRGLQYSSESDFPLLLSDWGQKDPAAVQKKIGQDCKNGKAVSVAASEFFDRYIKRLERSSDAVLAADAARYKALQEFLVTNSSSLLVWRCGTTRIDIYIVMTTVNGHVLALKTTAIET